MNRNGNKSMLLYLSGSIPIVSQGKRYNIPLELWIFPDYPRTPPKAFVKTAPGKIQDN